MTRILPLLALSGCIFITDTDRLARPGAAASGDTATWLGDDDDVLGDDDDDVGTGVPGSWVDVSVAPLASCAIDDTFEVRCWDAYDEVEQWIPGVPDAPGDPLFEEVHMGTRLGCARADDGETRCFGAPGGTDLNPEPNILETPGTFDVVRCTGTACCGIDPGGALTCWTDEPDIATYGDTLDGRTFVDVAGSADHWCALEQGTGELVCFTLRSNIGPPDLDWTDADPPTGLYGNTTVLCAANDAAAVCWTAQSRGPLDVRDLDTVVSKQAYANAQQFNLCGLQGGSVVCFTSPGQTAYAPTIPEGNWVHLSMVDGGGCVLDGDGLAACWGGGAQLPHNASN